MSAAANRTGALGPRPRPYSPHVSDAVCSMHQRVGAVSIWLSRVGLLFNQGQLIAAYYPARNVVVYEPSARGNHIKHIFRWALDLKTEAQPEREFHRELMTELAGVMHQLDMIFNPR